MLPTARLRIYLKRPFLHSPHYDCTSLHPGKRGGGDGRSRNPPKPPPPRKPVGQSVQLRLWGDLRMRTRRAYPPVVVPGDLAGHR
jgi:hypothetical protein